MKINQAGISLIKKFEGLALTAYMDPVGVWTIGYGNISYPDGSSVKLGDTITESEANNLLDSKLDEFSKTVQTLVPPFLNDNEFSALVSFTYNLGPQAFTNSTLLKKVNADPTDPTIRDEFMKWVNAGGVELPGLVARRSAEADLYFKKKETSDGSSPSPSSEQLQSHGT